MTIEYIRYDLKDHSPETFLAAYEEAAKSLQAAPECLSYEMTRCEEDARSFILRIHWASTQAHLEGFRKGPHFPPFLAAIRAFMPEIAECGITRRHHGWGTGEEAALSRSSTRAYIPATRRNARGRPMPMPAAEIDRMIKAGIPDAQVEIIDLAGDDNHFSAIVTSSEFEGLTKLKQHQLVYKALGTHMGGALHALQLQTLTPKA